MDTTTARSLEDWVRKNKILAKLAAGAISAEQASRLVNQAETEGHEVLCGKVTQKGAVYHSRTRMEGSSGHAKDVKAQLTYADRELLLQTLDSMTNAWQGSDAELLARVFEWTKQLSPTYGFEYALTRDVTALTRFLDLHKSDEDVAHIARGGLLYVLLDEGAQVDRLRAFGLLDDAFVCNYAVHEIRRRLGEPATYTPPRLTDAERDRAETLFLEFIGEPTFGDAELVAAAKRTMESWGNLRHAGLLRRLRRDIEFLIGVVNDHRRCEEHKGYARGALSYLVCEDDAIDDRMGLIGFLDDSFIIHLAVDLIEPNREPWLELLDATIAAWPFLSNLLLDDGSGVSLPSEYMIVSSALSCAELRTATSADSTVLIVPSTGPTPYLLGVVATIGLIQSTGQRHVSGLEFRDGQKVLVDYCAIAEFAGFGECNGRRMFKLRQFRTERGERLERIRYWPISDLGRLTPVDRSRVPRGSLSYDLSHSDITLPGLEYLFGDDSVSHLSAVHKRIVVITPVALAQQFSKELSIHGWPLKDVLPMGHISPGAETVRPWSSRFGKLEPLLIFASDADMATAFVEEDPKRYALVVIDSTGRNLAKHASLRRLRRFNVPTLLVATERAVDDVNMADSAIWEWTSDDFGELVWPEYSSGKATGILSQHERRLHTSASATPIVQRVCLPAATVAFEAHRRIQQLAKERGQDKLAELDELVAIGFWIVSHLLRSATPIDEQLPSFESLMQQFAKFDDLRSTSNYLSDGEQASAQDFFGRACELFDALRMDNPKARRVQDVLADHPRAAIICPDARLLGDLQHHYSHRVSRILATNQADVECSHGVIIPGWFRKSRMAGLLVPPIANPLTIVLYDVESLWYGGFVNERHRSRQQRRGNSNRGEFFSQLDGWRAPDVPAPADTKPDQALQEVEEMQDRILDGYKARIYETNRTTDSEDTVAARLVLFVGGAYGFFTDTYKLSVVTHLIEAVFDEDDERSAVLQTLASKLQVGDAIVFRQSSRDIIREVADTLLAPGTREVSATWRRALLGYARQHNLSGAQLCRRLRDAGCRVQQQAVEGWLRSDDMIAPQAYRRDVTAIAKATDDAELINNLGAVIGAIANVRSAHLRASVILARQVRQLAGEVLRQEQADAAAVQLHDGFVIVRVAEVASETTEVRIGAVNRLIEGDSWLE